MGAEAAGVTAPSRVGASVADRRTKERDRGHEDAGCAHCRRIVAGVFFSI